MMIKLDKPLVLVGLMGSGKTTLGCALADALGLGFTDADDVIVARAGKTIPAIFADDGEDAFRTAERQAIASLLDHATPQVIATGGGSFINDETRMLVKEKALSLWIKADLDTLVARTAGDDNRPLLAGGDPRAALGALMDKRYPVYAQADITVETGTEPVEQTLDRIMDALRALCGHN